MGLDTLARFGDFQPATSQSASGMGGDDGTRYSDEQLYALALYVYSLQPPPNPNPLDDRAVRGQQVFSREGCARLPHPAAIYEQQTDSRDRLQRSRRSPQIRRHPECLGGDGPGAGDANRRGTGFYKIPSLRGVWFRNGFGHGGNADTLEEWLDPARLKEDYLPKGYHRGPGPILGHPFGLKLSPEDKQALIAFLKTL